MSNLLSYETLSRIAEETIPSGDHKLLHIDSREAWIDTVIFLVENHGFKPTKKNLAVLANNWEPLLFQKYSALN